MKFNLNINDINYIKIVYNDADNVGHCAKAAIRRVGDKEILACMKYEKDLKLLFPQEVSVGFACNDALYVCKTTLKMIEQSFSYIYFTLKTPDEVEYQQNRAYFRVKMDEDVLLNFNETSLSCQIYDISANGIRLKLSENRQIPEDVVLDILFSPRNIKTRAKFVRWDDEDGILKAAFTYIDIPEASRDLISKKCIQKQLSDKRKSIM